MEFTTETIKEFKNYLTKKGKLISTINCYSTDIKEFICYIHEKKIDESQIDLNIINSYRNHLIYKINLCSNSLRRKIISLKQFYRFLNEEKKISTNTLEYSLIPSRDESLPNQLSHCDIDALVDVAISQKNTFKAKRDSAIVHLLAYEGLKISELILLKWSDFLYLREISSLRIRGKRHRILSLHTESANSLIELKNYILEKNSATNKKQEDHEMFCAFKGRESYTPKGKISRHGLKFLLYELGEKCGLKYVNAEQLRHYSIKLQIANGKNAEDIMEHLGLKQRGNITKHFKNTEINLDEQ